MARRSKRKRSEPQATLSDLVSEPESVSKPEPLYHTPMSSDFPQGSIGPANWVDPVTYRALKAKFSKKKKTTPKKTTKKKKSSRKGYYRNYGGSLAGMGPIVITGRGGYFTDKLKTGASAAYRALQRGIPAGTFSRLGTAAGGAMFGAPGASVGSFLGQGVSNVLGFGDYAIRKNDLLQVHEGMPVPTFNDLNQGIVVCHREYIADISVASTAFQNRAFALQPGDNTTFPWLSQIAAQFEQYELLGCLIQFRSTSSDFGTTTNLAMGTVIMATEYDVVDANYASKLEMENAQYSMSGKPSHDMIHPIECDPSLVGPYGLKYIRSGPVPSGKDPRLYDHGTFQLATQGITTAAGSVIGELWVTYKIAFYKPQFNLGTDIRTDYYIGTTASAGSPWGIVLPQAGSSLGTGVSGTTLSFPDTIPTGSILSVNCVILGSSSAIVNPTFTFNNCTKLYSTNTNNETTSRMFYFIIVKKTADSMNITATGATMLSAVTETRLIVTQIDQELAYG